LTPETAFSKGAATARVREIVRDVFASFESGSIQQLIHQMARKLLSEIPSIAEVRLEANNRTWDTIAEQGEELGAYIDARPPYGCLGLTLRRNQS
jgi:urate oxidase